VEHQNDLSGRLFHFAVRCIKFLRKLPTTAEYKVIKYQLIKASTSGGVNHNEARTSTSGAGFHNKVKTALREMIETND